MAGLSLGRRDLAATRLQLGRWFEHKFGDPVDIGEMRPANRAAGWSSESLLFSVDGAREFVARIPPTGGGIYAEYDLAGQTRTQQLLHNYGIATPAPIRYEADSSWLGSNFLVMPRIVGHTPSDTSYAVKGWLHGAGVDVQRRVHDSFLDTLVALQRVPIEEAPWLKRAQGVGNDGELGWWRDYIEWATDKQVPAVITDAFDWLYRHQPSEQPDLAICWGDARLSNAIFDDTGQIVGVLDWEQACLCPAETDFAWWLATRRQTMEVNGIDADPELPGFDSQGQVVRRFEELIGRPLVDLRWYEIFAMVRMGCCILRVQWLLRSMGQGNHGLTRAPIMPAWAIEAIR
ncbi:phosphotransferase family protein [Mycobacterium montefiorense]|uniref:Aminoglycoside phosphotransferase n=1 Tax=Mycobacterium montefiorense TaxID=154654 RepID=A0AA37PIH2_9MYCO|nr:phosphotransferase family protein [Mycobacterium montefiorense]GBG37316.1 putative aminoglycoside phosphotransferase [Mycobacterium montefiorense]GKU35816.1 putative aminoglycoside phosphotransferase [Mycobacterium montefiorense]GKU39781.1 putative aminoglycoside phosphotransferase [Mycobacterium montefiorense]GKU47655.1 putative aminoglycoside phosphotransferase [Mycobacterium montefiorense]GKU48879.1 putative aminoglycoside phosphotransferase [Mycobacterium montefiorense]